MSGKVLVTDVCEVRSVNGAVVCS